MCADVCPSLLLLHFVGPTHYSLKGDKGTAWVLFYYLRQRGGEVEEDDDDSPFVHVKIRY